MGMVFRQSAKTAIVVFGGALLGAITLWVSTRYMPRQHFGFFQTVTKWAVLMTQILLFGVNSTLTVFIHRFSDSAIKKKLLITISLLVPIAITLLATMGYQLGKAFVVEHFQEVDRPLMSRFFLWLPLYTTLFVYMTLLEQYLGSQMKVAVSAFAREIVLRVVSLVILALYASGYIDFDGYFIGSVLAYLLPICIMLVISLKTEAFGISFKFRALSKAEYSEIIKFTWYHFLLSAAFIILASIDVTLLPFYDRSGFASGAVYSVALFLLSFVQLPYKSMLIAAYTVLAEAYAQNNLEKAKDVYIRSSLNMLIGTLAISVIICCNLNNFATIIGSNRNYAEVTNIFLILFIGKLFDTATGMNDQVLSVTNHYRFLLIVSISSIIITFGVLRYAIPIYGVYGAAAGMTVSLIIFNAAKYIFIWIRLGIQPFSRNTALVVVSALPALASGIFLPNFFYKGRHIYINTFLDASLRSTVVVLLYIAMLVMLKPSPDLSEYLQSIKRNKRLF